MKRKNLLLMLLLAFALPWAAQAYNHQVQIGDGTSGQRIAPINLYYDNSFTQQIYTAAQINDGCSYAGDIESISFYYAGSEEKTVPITVYMMTTTKGAFESTTDWVTVSDNDIVFDDDWTVPSTAGWVTINLTTPFAYDGTSNLLITINKSHYDDYIDQSWRYTAVSNNQLIYARRDDNGNVGAYDPDAPGTAYGITSYLPNILINMTIPHPAPSALAVDDLGSRTATISWTAPTTTNTLTGYAYEYTDGTTTVNGTATGTTANLSGLTPETDYEFQVKAVYSDGESCWSETLDFTTLEDCPTPINLAVVDGTLAARNAQISWLGSGADSYTVQTGTLGQISNATVLSEGFEGGTMPAGWSRTGSYWQITSGTGNSSYTGAATGNYNAGCYISSYSGSDILVTPAMDLSDAVSATLNFNFWNTDWDGDVSTLNVYYRVGGGTWNLLYTDDQPNDDWTAVPTITLTGLAANYQIGFEYESGYSYGMGIDDVEVVAQIASITWTDFDTNASNPFDFNNTLSPETTYRVRVFGVCGGEPGNPSKTLVFTTTASCLMPTNLVVTTNGATATATWEGVASTYNIDINGTVYNDVTSPYEFPVELSTTYAVKVQANCTGETSSWTDAYSFTTPPCIGGHEIEYTLNDSWGDGWIGGTNNPTISAILINEACDVYETLTLPASTSTGSGSLTLCGEYYQLVWQAGAYPGECSFTLIVDGTPVYTNQSGSGLTDGQVLYTIGTAPDMLPKPTDIANGTPDKREVELSWTENGTATAWEICVNGDETNLIGTQENPYTLDGLTPDTDYAVKVRSTNGTDVSCWTDEITFHTAEACAKPTNLAANNITINSATLSWTGTADNYVLQYRPWVEVGNVIPTGVLTQYTFDLSQFTGNGSIAIRHFDVSGLFRLNIDDIKVTNANDEVLLFEDFESNAFPTAWTFLDKDGDGQNWYIYSTDEVDANGNPYMNGTHTATSASYNGGYDLYPDNWMIIPNVELGGTLTLYSRGQDASWAGENFSVYVQADNGVTEVEITNATSYQATNLLPNTPYDWQVKSDCGEYESNWAASDFATLDNLKTFITDGDWNEDANWDPVGVPTAEYKVSIEAEANIPAGVVAVAKKATIGTNGSITIEDGGELKQGSATLKVTMEKEITGIGLDNWNDENYHGGWAFISTPFSGTTKFGIQDNWNYVNNLKEGDYDFYSFDASQVAEEWRYNNDSYDMYSGEGYLYANQEDQTLEFVGNVGPSVNATVTKEFTFDGESTAPFNGWALVGNPFSCSTYISYLNGDTPTEANFYTLNTDGDGYELSETNIALPPLTGAFINYEATGTVQFASEVPSGNGSGMLNMTLNQGRGKVDQARVRFGRGHNLKHMSFRNNSSKLFIPQDNDYAVVYTEDNVGEMPVSFKAEKNGTYTLGFNTENVEFSYLHLIDNMTGADVDLLANSSYSFEAQTTDYASRFKLVFATGSNDDNFAFFNNGNIIVNNEGEATLQVMDVNGRIIRSESINGTASIKMNASAGVYMIRLINGNDVKVQKIVVR